MKKIGLILMSMFVIATIFNSCVDDIMDLDDPRDGIAKTWRVTEEASGLNYDVVITKDPSDKTKVIFSNLSDTKSNELIYATFDGENFKIPLQVINEGTSEGPYAFEGDGYTNKDGTAIRLDYDFTWGDDDPVNIIAYFGKVFVTKKKKTIASLSE